MEFRIGEKVKIKPGTHTARITGEVILTIVRIADGGKTLFVTGGQSGARWVGADEVDLVDEQSVGT